MADDFMGHVIFVQFGAKWNLLCSKSKHDPCIVWTCIADSEKLQINLQISEKIKHRKQYLSVYNLTVFFFFFLDLFIFFETNVSVVD